MKNKKNKLDVKFVEPKYDDPVYVGNELNKHISHIIYISAEEIDENKVFLFNDFAYRCQYAVIEGKKVLFGIVVASMDFDDEEADRPIAPDPDADINVIVPVFPAKGFKGFFIMPNASVVPDYRFTIDAFDDGDNDGGMDIGEIFSNPNNPTLN